MQVLKKASFMTDSGISVSLSQTMHLLDETERSSYSEWSQNLDAQYLQRLEQPLIMRCRDNQAKLDINFDRLGALSVCLPHLVLNICSCGLWTFPQCRLRPVHKTTLKCTEKTLSLNKMNQLTN